MTVRRVDPPPDEEQSALDPVPLTPPPDSGWVRYDLAAITPGPPKRPASLGLFYRGATNLLAGDPGGGKTFVGLQAGVEAIRRGGSFIFCDYEDDQTTCTERLSALGADADALADTLYLRGFDAFGDSFVDWLRRLVAQLGEVVILIDSFAEALAMAGYDEDRAPDVTRWFQTVARPLSDAGATVIVVDHLGKAGSTGARRIRGSGHKLAGVDGLAAILEPIEPFDRERSGSGQVIVAKDRLGFVGGRDATAANVVFAVAGGSLYAVRIHHLAPGDDHAASLTISGPAALDEDF